MYIVQCTVYSVQCAIHSLQCTVCNVQFTVYSVSSICVSPGLKRCLSIEAVNIKHNTKQGLSIVRDMTFSKDNIHYLYLSFSSFHPSPPPSVPPLPPIPLLLIFPSLPASFRPSSSSHTSPSHLSIPTCPPPYPPLSNSTPFTVSSTRPVSDLIYPYPYSLFAHGVNYSSPWNCS